MPINCFSPSQSSGSIAFSRSCTSSRKLLASYSVDTDRCSLLVSFRHSETTIKQGRSNPMIIHDLSSLYILFRLYIDSYIQKLTLKKQWWIITLQSYNAHLSSHSPDLTVTYKTYSYTQVNVHLTINKYLPITTLFADTNPHE